MHRIIHKASELPPEWELLSGDNLYMTIPFLKMLEEVQKKQTEYHLFYDSNNNLDSIFVLFIYPDFPFFMNTILPYTKKIRMIYYPLPLSKSTLVLGEKTRKEVETVIKKIKGFTMLANIPKKDLMDFPYELSFARCAIRIKWDSMDDYLNSLRSHYRYKYRKNLKQTKDLTIKEIDPADFNSELYRLYENVYERTDIQINKAEPAFFQSEFSKIITIGTTNRTLGFVQLIVNGKELIFSLIGLDYGLNGKYNLYLRLMLEVIKYGIDNGFDSVDLGQTTYDAKRKLGSDIEELYIQVNHHNKLYFKLVLLFRRMLVHKQDYSKSYNVFKEEREDS